MSLMLPTRFPQWLRSRPFLLVPSLRWWNIHQRHKTLLPTCIVLLVAAGGLLTLPIAGHALEAVARNPVTPFTVLAAVCAVSTVRRKAHIHRSRVDSWLASLNAPASVVPRALLAPLVQILLLLLAVAIPLIAGSLTRTAAVTLWLATGAAYVAGAAVGWLSLSRHNKTIRTPDFQYVAVRGPRADWAQKPKLDPLSYWTVGQARVFAKPKGAARVVLLVFLAVPMSTRGTPGEQAMAIAAGAWVLLYVGSLILAGVTVVFAAARWLAPTTINYRQLAVAVGYRALLAQVWTWAWALFLAYAAGLRITFRVGLPLAVLCLLLSCVAIGGAARVATKFGGKRSS